VGKNLHVRGVECKGKHVSCNRIAKRVCKEDEDCKTKALEACRISRKKTVKKAQSKSIKKCKCQKKALKICGTDEGCRITHVTKCSKKCTLKRTARVCRKVVRSSCKQIARAVCTTKKCARKAIKECKKERKHVRKITKRVPPHCKSLAVKKCFSEEGGKECRRAVIEKCVKKHHSSRYCKKVHGKSIRKTSRKIAHGLCRGKEGKKYVRCHKRVVKHVRRHHKKVRRHTNKALRKCECKAKAVNTCSSESNVHECKQTFIKTCHKECLKNSKKEKKRCSKLAKKSAKKKLNALQEL
jgi:hypothetical protein